MNLEQAHRIARERGPNMLVYWIARAILQPAALLYFRLRRIGLAHVPKHGPLLMASNHRSFSDPFFIGMCIGRPLRFVAKVELFERRWQARLLLALGAIPIRRNESDEQAMETARIILEQGGAVGIFPEGTRVRPGPLGEPRRGVGRLALETGAPVVPVALIGTEDIRNGWRIRPRRVVVRCGRPLTYPRPLDNVSSRMAAEVTSRIWNCIALQWEWLGGAVPVRRAVVVGAGSWGTAIATLLARGGASVQLVCRSDDQVAELRDRAINSRYLPGVSLARDIRAIKASEINWRDVDVACLAVPSNALTETIRSLAPIPDGVGIGVFSKGLVAPDGELPASIALESLAPAQGQRSIAYVGGPAHALEAVERGATVVVAANDSEFRERLRASLCAGGVATQSSEDLVGVQLAGVAKNAAALAAGAAIGMGPNAAGAVAGRVYAECFELGRAWGADPVSFAGIAGAGDLVATVIASHSRNRRAGELLSEGVSADRIAESLGQVPEGVEMIPVLATAAHRRGVATPAIDELAGLIEGTVEPQRWVEHAVSTRTRSHAA